MLNLFAAADPRARPARYGAPHSEPGVLHATASASGHVTTRPELAGSAIHVTGGSANAVLSRLPNAPQQRCHQRDGDGGRLQSVAVRHHRPSAWSSPHANDHQRVQPIHPHGMLPPDPSDSAAGNNQSRIPHSRLGEPWRVPHFHMRAASPSRKTRWRTPYLAFGKDRHRNPQVGTSLTRR
jgi:hypothetical protein